MPPLLTCARALRCSRQSSPWHQISCVRRSMRPGYRRTPEPPYPAAVEDATAAYRWLLHNGATPARTVIAGDSAGGGLTVATLVALRDAGEALPAAGVCIS